MDEPTRLIPTLFGGRYERGPMLGRGGMAAVYRARDRRLERDVALKVALPSGGMDAATRARAAREARVLAALEDPRVVRVLDAGEEAGLPYLVMELIEGTSLAERMRAGPLDPAEAARIGAAVAGGLAAVHARGLVHRDVKPDNVLLLEDGGVRLVDFGIARPDGLGAETTATAPGIVVGTPGYIPPEVFQGARPDARGDVYALGVTLHRALAGSAPPAALTALVDELAAADPAARPTAAAAEDRLTLLAEPVAPTLVMPVAAAGRRRGRRAAALCAAVAAALALALGIARLGGGSGDGPVPGAPSTAAATTSLAATAPATTAPASTGAITVEVTSTVDGGKEIAREARKQRHGEGKHRGDRKHGDKGD
jgi:eukaryotic-like serine/threonine-protein kinase